MSRFNRLTQAEKEQYWESLRVIDEAKRVKAKPTEEQISELEAGDYYVFENTIYFNASAVDFRQIHYVCAFCRSKHKKDGTPYKRAKKVTHHHGCSSIKIGHYEAGRSPHCCDYRNQRKTNPIGYEISIHVTRTTEGSIPATKTKK